MTITIAIAGKGGTGKTTVAAFLIQLLADRGTVLAVDADPSSNLNLALGLPLEETVGGIREGMAEEVSSGRFPVGIPKQDYLDLRINEALVESAWVDLLAMGRPEGPGCYCAANSMLRAILDRLIGSYDYVVIDNEAGMEHLSRRTTRDVDILIAVSDPTMRGITTVARIRDLAAELHTKIGRTALVINRVNESWPEPVMKAVEELGVELIGLIPEDRRIGEYDATGRPLIELPTDSPARLAVHDVARRLGLI
ncbi:MAG: AAA family ATPase [Anaerolineae bacterium]|jgi:CO dehydrogenase maturation factor|nr:AAA family ATPase [Anaerolineae bacterium]MDH7474944.1 AAA family ATPase [Anaerolineae bacterium]